MFITAKQASMKWKISDRRVRILCAEGKVTGELYQEGRIWRIPINATKPNDGRYKTNESLLSQIDRKKKNSIEWAFHRRGISKTEWRIYYWIYI
ncbi:hypothetical protein ONA22_02365 [Mycoplasmopsis cynos]|uniref:hypothetical protein n=1 Tax=Mycoplasmopsis cynos TaxID=171284 RepID=UPI0024CDA1DC|nr:hypothetical protein [Mycoplasmopsis cynos]WAM03847.1 hypothetical protein ONA22_02365 [Mycoplasmopsis cynos]